MSNNEAVRRPFVAGQFYEADPTRLAASIDRMYRECGVVPLSQPEKPSIRALILPHAGYVYSGPTAVKTAARIKGCHYRRVVVIAPSHRVAFRGLALSGYTAYATPLGPIPIDTAAVAALAARRDPLLRRLDAAHEGEHALEVELPILQRMLPEFELLPFICGDLDNTAAKILAEQLLPYWNEETLWVISSDFTHYGRSFGYVPFTSEIKEHLRELDLGAADRIVKLNLADFTDYIETTGATICGWNPIRVLLATIAASGQAIHAERTDYTTSGDLTGDFSHCVSYAGFVFTA